MRTPALRSWTDLNRHLKTASEQECRTLLTLERRGLARQVFLRRIHSRMNKMRAMRERSELGIMKGDAE